MSVLDGNPIHVEVSTTDGESKGASISNPVLGGKSVLNPINVDESTRDGELKGTSISNPIFSTSASASQAIEVLVNLKSAPNVALALQAIKVQKTGKSNSLQKLEAEAGVDSNAEADVNSTLRNKPTKAIRMKDITCLSNRRFLFKAVFSEAKGDYTASLALSFDKKGSAFDPIKRCEKHVATTIDQECPCICIYNLFSRIQSGIPGFKKENGGHYDNRQFLYPKAYDGKYAFRHVSSIKRSDIKIDVPFMQDQCMPTTKTIKSFVVPESSPALDAAPKYKDGFSSSRIKSNGEINSNARQYSRKREGGRQRHTETTASVSRMKPTEKCDKTNEKCDSFRYCVRKCNTDPTTNEFGVTSLIDLRANGCVFICGSEYVVEDNLQHPTVTVSGANIGTKNNVPIKTMAALAKTKSGEEVICVFHNAAHVHDTSMSRIFISYEQMSSCVTNIQLNKNKFDDDADNHFQESVTINIHSFEVKRRPTIFCSDKEKRIPFLDLKPFSQQQFKTLTKVHMTSPDAWIPPNKLKSQKCCSFCGTVNCTRPRCVKLHSFGNGYVPTKELEPGEYIIHKTNKKMSDIVVNSSAKTDYPLDLRAHARKNCKGFQDVFQLAHPPNNAHNLDFGRKKKEKKMTPGHKVQQRHEEQWNNKKTSASTDFLSTKKLGRDRVFVDNYVPDRTGLTAGVHECAKAEALIGFESFFVTNLQILVLEDWSNGKLPKRTINRLKERNHHQPALCQDRSDFFPETYEAQQSHHGLSQDSFCTQSLLEQNIISPNKYSQESVCMLNKPSISKFLDCVSEDDDTNFMDVLLYQNKIDQPPAKYHFDAIVNHQGPLQKNHPKFKSCRYNISVQWRSGETTWEPLNNFVKSHPNEVAKYVVDNRLQHLLEDVLWGMTSVKQEVERLTSTSTSTSTQVNRYTKKARKKRKPIKKDLTKKARKKRKPGSILDRGRDKRLKPSHQR